MKNRLQDRYPIAPQALHPFERNPHNFLSDMLIKLSTSRGSCCSIAMTKPVIVGKILYELLDFDTLAPEVQS